VLVGTRTIGEGKTISAVHFHSSVADDVHRQLAAELFNFSWDVMESTDRSEEALETLIQAAHASLFHWGLVGTPLELARGEWLVSRAYAVAGRADPALRHAARSLRHCVGNALSDFDVGFACEAMARAYCLAEDTASRDQYVTAARQAAQGVADQDVQRWLVSNIDAVELLSIPRWDSASNIKPEGGDLGSPR
jgi:hypothetical protein